jgi:TonB family protein
MLSRVGLESSITSERGLQQQRICTSDSVLEAVRCVGISMVTRLILACLLFSSFGFADLKYRMHTTGRPVPTPDRIVYVRGERIRTEFPDTGRVNIRQCDLNRIVHLDLQTKTYRIQQIEPKPEASEDESVPNAGPSSCRMKLRKQIEETGEFEKLLGFDAEHIRVFLYMEPVPDSCPENQSAASTLVQQRDGWYIQVPWLPECPAPKEKNTSTNRAFDMPDHYLRSDGTLTPDLLPVKVEVKRRKRQELQTAFTAEASDISTETLDPALFDVPSDYREVPAPNAGNCSGAAEIVAHLDDGSPVYRVGCGIKPPRIIRQAEPEYSERARKKKIAGTVVLSSIVDSNGSVRDVQITQSLERSLDQQAIAALAKWKFEPATKDGEPVAVRLEIEMSFRLY